MAAEVASGADPAAPGSRGSWVAALGVERWTSAERLERITAAARAVFDVPMAFVNVADADTLHTLTPFAALPGLQAPLSASFCQYTLARGEPLCIADTADDSRTAQLPGVQRHGVGFYAGAPMIAPDGTVYGTVCVMDVAPRALDDAQLALLPEFAVWAQRVLAGGADQDRLRAVTTAMLPAPIVTPGFTVSGMSVPHGAVSGDFYDWRRSGTIVQFTLVDVMGKGAAAGLVAATIRAALGAVSDRTASDAVDALETLVSGLLQRVESFATLVHGHLDTRTGRVDFVDAGHGLVLHLPAGGAAQILSAHDLPIGLHSLGTPRQTRSLLLRPGDALVVTSDGAPELGDGTLGALIELAATYRAAPDVDQFLDAVRATAAAAKPDDDVTILVLARASHRP